MRLHEKEITIPVTKKHQKLLAYLETNIASNLQEGEAPVRLAVTKTDNQHYHVELGVLDHGSASKNPIKESIFEFKHRQIENTEKFNAVLLIPTGVGAELGGHSGDGGPLSRLMASACDTLITHPNVVNAADVNELPENGLYVEGSVISQLLMGAVGLQKVRGNRVALIMDDHTDRCISEHTINAASTARAALGMNCPLVVKMEDKIDMHATYSPSGRAVGRIGHLQRIIDVLEEHRSKFDAVAISSQIGVPKSYHQDYFLGGMVNPWGGVEAMLTHSISSIFGIPSAHAPMMESQEVLNLNVGVVDPRMAAEAVSVTYLHCVFKGLNKSPKIIADSSQFINPNVISASDVSCLIIPDGCVGLPTLAALEQGIPVIAVRENKNIMQNSLEDLPFEEGKLFIVDNYLEAIGVMTALKSGLALETVRRPLAHTKVIPELKEEIVKSYENVVKLRAR
jgi:Protein of unknown function (DUF3326)